MSSRTHRLAGMAAALLFVFGLLLEAQPPSSSAVPMPDSTAASAF